MGSRQPIGYIDPNFPNPMGPQDARIIIYGYTPNFALCIVALVFFAIAFSIHSIQVTRYRTWSFLPLTFACLMEIVGYIGRALSAKLSPYNIIYFIINYFFIVTAPVLISASIYVCLSNLVSWAQREGMDFVARRYLRPRPILALFISCDVLATILQVVGAALIGRASSDGKDPTSANHILLGGLCLQTLGFVLFLSLLAIFITMQRRDSQFTRLPTLRFFIVALTAASILVFLRTVFRLAETAQGLGGTASTHEVYFACLEFVPMILAVWILAIWHPGRCIPGLSSKVV